MKENLTVPFLENQTGYENLLKNWTGSSKLLHELEPMVVFKKWELPNIG
jgi:hypothetical protein